jgi:hypothetical protein
VWKRRLHIQSLKNKFRKHSRLYLQYPRGGKCKSSTISGKNRHDISVQYIYPSFWAPQVLVLWISDSCSLKVSEHLTYGTLMSFCPRISEPFPQWLSACPVSPSLGRTFRPEDDEDDAAIWRCPALQPCSFSQNLSALFLSYVLLSVLFLSYVSLSPVPLLCCSQVCSSSLSLWALSLLFSLRPISSVSLSLSHIPLLCLSQVGYFPLSL